MCADIQIKQAFYVETAIKVVDSTECSGYAVIPPGGKHYKKPLGLTMSSAWLTVKGQVISLTDHFQWQRLQAGLIHLEIQPILPAASYSPCSK